MIARFLFLGKESGLLGICMFSIILYRAMLSMNAVTGRYQITFEENYTQLIISRLDGGRICDQAYQDGILTLVRKGIGGFIIFGGNRDDVTPSLISFSQWLRHPYLLHRILRGGGTADSGFYEFSLSDGSQGSY